MHLPYEGILLAASWFPSIKSHYVYLVGVCLFYLSSYNAPSSVCWVRLLYVRQPKYIFTLMFTFTFTFTYMYHLTLDSDPSWTLLFQVWLCLAEVEVWLRDAGGNPSLQLPQAVHQVPKMRSDTQQHVKGCLEERPALGAFDTHALHDCLHWGRTMFLTVSTQWHNMYMQTDRKVACLRFPPPRRDIHLYKPVSLVSSQDKQ